MLLTATGVDAAQVDDYNVPPRVQECLEQQQLVIRNDVNPFYVAGDFNRDGILDFAVQVRASTTAKRCKLICDGARASRTLLGAGVPFAGGDDLRFDAWHVVGRPEARAAARLRSIGDALMLFIKEAASGLAYWNGRQWVWKELDG